MTKLDAIITYEGTQDVYAPILGRAQTGLQAFFQMVARTALGRPAIGVQSGRPISSRYRVQSLAYLAFRVSGVRLGAPIRY